MNPQHTFAARALRWFFAGCALFFPAAAQADPLRALYVHTDRIAPPDAAPEARAVAIADVVAQAARCGLDTLFPYTNTTGGHAHHPGGPLAASPAGQWDALDALATAARARGIRVMPAVCVLASGHDAPAGILDARPEWALRDADGAPIGWISPAHPDARAWVVRMIAEVANRTRADGILLDYLRYPNKDTLLDPGSAARFDAAAPPGEGPADRADRLQRFKEDAISALMDEIAAALRADRPDFPLALYTWGPHVAAGHRVAQPWHRWVAAGQISLVNVSGYCYRDNYGDRYLDRFEARLAGAARLVRDHGGSAALSFALGLQTSHGAVPDAAEIPAYLAAARRAGVPGVAVFAWSSLAPMAAGVAAKGWFRDGVTPGWRVRARVDFGPDRGQNFGSLFEARDADGVVVAGAGFLGAYNTYHRADRHTLHVFVRPSADTSPVEVGPLPRPSPACHHYLFDVDGQVFATDRRSASTPTRWSPGENAWLATDPPRAPETRVGAHRIAFLGNDLEVDGRRVPLIEPAAGAVGSHYYAAGTLFFHFAEADSPARQTHLHACAWDPAAESRVRVEDAVVLRLDAPGEFPYSYGQLGGDVLVGTNNGGVYRFRAGRWETLRAADVATSFQLYAMLNHHDRLLMGHYPSGELYEVAGDAVLRIADWPPRVPGASPRAREAQTLAIYRGELFVGVWPWGEVWRLPRPDAAWTPVGRLFSHPDAVPEVTAPYEAEMGALGAPVNNLWGQRVTGLVPIGGDLIASTANKNGAPCDDARAMHDDARWLEYGAAHRLRLPGHLSVPIRWTGNATVIEMRVGVEASLEILQDGERLGSMALPGHFVSDPAPVHIEWGRGVHGPFHGRAVEGDLIGVGVEAQP